jgi:Flp pilus assembly protein TadG
MHCTSINSGSHSRKPRVGERGAALVEFGLVLIPLLAVVMLILDIAWAIFAQATIQEAVREGVRTGVTAKIAGSCTTVTCTVQDTVQAYSFGFISPGNQSALVQVTYYSPAGGVLTQVPSTSASADVGGNIIQVTVTGITVKALGAIMLTQHSVSIGATASDVIESNPNPGAP